LYYGFIWPQRKFSWCAAVPSFAEATEDRPAAAKQNPAQQASSTVRVGFVRGLLWFRRQSSAQQLQHLPLPAVQGLQLVYYLCRVEHIFGFCPFLPAGRRGTGFAFSHVFVFLKVRRFSAVAGGVSGAAVRLF